MNPTKQQLDELWDVLEEKYKKDRHDGLVGARLSDYGSGWEKCKMLAANWPELLLLGALWGVKNRERGKTQAQAIDDEARYWGLAKSALNLAVKGQHTSLRHQGRRGRR